MEQLQQWVETYEASEGPDVCRRVPLAAKENLGGAATVLQIAGGERTTVFLTSLTSDGRAFVCGSSVDGQLGLADDKDALKAALIETRARLSGAEALIEQLQLVIAKMKREKYGPRSERSPTEARSILAVVMPGATIEGAPGFPRAVLWRASRSPRSRR